MSKFYIAPDEVTTFERHGDKIVFRIEVPVKSLELLERIQTTAWRGKRIPTQYRLNLREILEKIEEHKNETSDAVGTDKGDKSQLAKKMGRQ
jgi:hypothetical protein